MYFVYIIKSITSNKYYIGCSDNVNRRLDEHNNRLSKYTKDKGPWVLVHKELFNQLSEARKREKQIKAWKKRVAIEKLIDAAFV